MYSAITAWLLRICDGPCRKARMDAIFVRMRIAGEVERLARVLRVLAGSPVERADHVQRTTIDDVRVDHRRSDIAVSEQSLDGADVRPCLQEVRREAVAQGVAGDSLVDLREPGCLLDRLLDG